MLVWTIGSGPTPITPPEGFEGVTWRWKLIAEGGAEQMVDFGATGTAMAMADEALPLGGAEARATAGRSEINRVQLMQNPPCRVELNSVEIRDRHS